MITLKTLPTATAQEVYNQVRDHLLTQNCRSEDEDGGCAYRGKNGLKCAAGCLIADDEYQSDLMEGRNWNAMIFPEEHQELIYSLQSIHDGVRVKDWKEQLIILADNYNLQP